MWYDWAMDCINDYLNMASSYKYHYIKNNDTIKNGDPSTESLFVNIYHDVDIILNALSISPSKYGYKYWKDAIFLYISSGKYQFSICNQIYPAIAKKYNKTAISVERAMRLCFENAMYDTEKKGDNFIYNYMKNYLLFPHNSELLIRITELIVSRDFQLKKSYTI